MGTQGMSLPAVRQVLAEACYEKRTDTSSERKRTSSLHQKCCQVLCCQGPTLTARMLVEGFGGLAEEGIDVSFTIGALFVAS